jgi:hypothetical protein
MSMWYLINPDGRRVGHNSAFIRFPSQGETVAPADWRVVTHDRGPFCAKSLIFPSTGRTSPLIFARTNGNRTPYAGAGSSGGLEELLFQGCQRPVFDRLGRRQCSESPVFGGDYRPAICPKEAPSCFAAMTYAMSFSVLIRPSRTRPWSTRARFFHAMPGFGSMRAISRYLMTNPEAKAIFKEVGYLKSIRITILAIPRVLRATWEAWKMPRKWP